MARVIPLPCGYRMRDLVTGLMVLQIGLAVVYALHVDQSGAAMKLPVLAFLCGLMMIVLAFGSGAVVDLVVGRFPSLARPRRCSSAILLGGPLLALTWALSQDHVMSWIVRTCQSGLQLKTLSDQLRAVVGW